MMKIKISNITWQRKALLYAAVVYFSKKLSGFRKSRIKIEIKLVAGLLTKQKYLGAAYRNSSRSFEIRLDASMKPIKLIKCLAHEMIHIQQWLTGQMEDLFKTRYQVRWGKRIYSPAKLAYQKHPWEIQAHKFEKDLYDSWVKFWTK